jgi:hypothetical protein
VRGVVRDSTAGVPLAGAVVVILDSARVASGRAIADAAGRFALARRSTSVSVRVNRIGYRPREVSIPPGQGDFSLELAMVRIPPLLDAVRVTDRELCPGSNDRGAAFLLWEQVRTGLLAQIVANDKGAGMAHALTFRRRVTPTDRVIRTQMIELRGGRSIRPFVAAASAAAFATEGYIEEDPGGRTFRAPDSEVLLDESFAATHCFHLQATNAAHTGEIGLAFTPRPDRHTVVDVAASSDRRFNRELRSFDFLYTEPEPAAMRAEAGGHMVFTTARTVCRSSSRIMRLPVLTAPSSLFDRTATAAAAG